MTRNNSIVHHRQSPDFLGPPHSPLTVDQDLTADDVQIGTILPSITVRRLKDHRGLLAEIDSQRHQLAAAGVLAVGCLTVVQGRSCRHG